MRSWLLSSGRLLPYTILLGPDALPPLFGAYTNHQAFLLPPVIAKPRWGHGPRLLWYASTV